jgi:lysozyme
MKVSTKGLQLIKSYEGCKLKAYQHKGDVPTIGFGSTFYEDGSKVKLGDQITQERADALFKIILSDFERGVENRVTSTLTQNQFDALVSFAYNVGLGALGKSTLLKKVNKNPGDPTIGLEFEKWIAKGSIFEIGLRKRRRAESDHYFT